MRYLQQPLFAGITFTAKHLRMLNETERRNVNCSILSLKCFNISHSGIQVTVVQIKRQLSANRIHRKRAIGTLRVVSLHGSCVCEEFRLSGMTIVNKSVNRQRHTFFRRFQNTSPVRIHLLSEQLLSDYLYIFVATLRQNVSFIV